MKPTNHESIKNRISKWIVAALVLAAAVPCFPQRISTTVATRESRVVLVSIADRKLAVVENGKVLAYFPVAVGSEASPSPTGEFVIVRRVANPTYYHAGVVLPAGQDNPVGTRWMGLNVKGYGIHGTNAPASIGHATSHGCIRLRNRDVERLFAMLHVGDVVKIRGERDEESAQIFGGDADVASTQIVAESIGQ